MKFRLFAIIAVGAAFLTGPASAQEMLRDMYLGLRLVGSVAAMDVTSSGFTGTTTVENDTDDVAGFGGVVGYRWRRIPLRTELEVTHRYRFDLDVRDVAGTTTDYESNVGTTTAMINTLLEWRNSSDFTPFGGVSLGWAHTVNETKRVNLTTRAETNQDASTDNFAWGVMTGVDWRFADNWSAEAAYRYINLGDVETGAFAAGDSFSAEDYVSHDLVITVNYHF